MPYETLDYLLDRANIEDVVRKLSMFVDEKRWDALVSDVLADELSIDYSKLFTKPVGKISAKSQVDEWKNLIGQLDGSQHSVGNIVAELPQPGQGERPTKVAVLAHYAVTHRRDAAPGDTWSWNVGTFRYEVTRTENAGNPWRVSGIDGTPAQQRGATNLYEGEVQMKQQHA